jgi:hypothetical protein
VEQKDMMSIKGVEIFSAGKWNGDEYSKADLSEMVLAFEENKTGSRPFLKLGHDPKQQLLQRDGLPSAGWVDKIYVSGDKLLADFVDIPRKVYALIKQKAYRKVSSEIFWNIKIGQKTYKRMLAAVALLGADTPGVQNLSDILAMYDIKDSYEKMGRGEDLDLKLFDLEESNKKEFITMEKTEAELKLEADLQAEKEKAEAQLKEFTAKQEEAQKELEALKQFKVDAEAREAKLNEEKAQAEIEKFYTEMAAEGLATPAMKEYIVELLGADKKEYTAKKLDKKDTVKEMLKLFKAGNEVNLDESSSKGKEYKMDDKAMDEKVQAYMKENKCSYGQAVKALKLKSK